VTADLGKRAAATDGDLARTAPDAGPSAGAETAGPVLRVDSISRNFGAFQAVRDVSLEVRLGEVVGLIGENGAGKSTLLNIISGTDRQSSGQVYIRGDQVNFRNYHDAAVHGVFRVFQELALVPNLTVWENFFLGHESAFVTAGIVNRRAAIRRAEEILARFDHGWIDVKRPVSAYPFAVQQLLELLKAFALAELLGHDSPVILLDEPTAALGLHELEFLRDTVHQIKQHSAVVFVSHRLAELLEWSDRIVVLKDGEVVGGGNAADMSETELHYLMVGRERDKAFYRESRQSEPSVDVLLKVEELSDGDAFADVSLEVRAGEVTGVAGVLGSGKSELGRAIFGAHPVQSGVVRYGADLPTVSLDTRRLVASGVGYVPPERKIDGFFDTFSVGKNLSFGQIVARRRSVLSLSEERRTIRRYIDLLRVRTPSTQASILALSGGNQQKVVLGRWLAAGVRLLILDNPTRGVDAGAKEEIYDLIRDLTDDGVAVLLISDDLLEVIGLSHHVLVMKEGRVVDDLRASVDDKPSEELLISRMV
jgi:ribose transport system ATP-binding protein